MWSDRRGRGPQARGRMRREGPRPGAVRESIRPDGHNGRMSPRALPPLTREERDELRRLYLAARRGTWEAERPDQPYVFAVERRPDGTETRFVVASCGRSVDARLVAAARNALPRLFAEIDEGRRPKTLQILGTVS